MNYGTCSVHMNYESIFSKTLVLITLNIILIKNNILKSKSKNLRSVFKFQMIKLYDLVDFTT